MLIDLLPALGFLMLNVFIPGPNVMNTIATAMGSGRRTGLACALACGCCLFLWALAALLGAAVVFAAFPQVLTIMTVIGGLLLLYFAYKFIRKALTPVMDVAAIDNVTMWAAFRQASLVMLSNPKVLTTWLAVVSLFPVVAKTETHIASFAVLSAAASFSGHALVATAFSTKRASRVYVRLYRPINGLVGAGFCVYGLKLLIDAFAS